MRKLHRSILIVGEEGHGLPDKMIQKVGQNRKLTVNTYMGLSTWNYQKIQ